MQRPLPRSLAIALPTALFLAACQQAPAPVEPIRAVRVLEVSKGQAEAFHEYAAEVRARTESRLSFRVAGKLVRRQAELGQPVRAGQPLAQLDPQDLKLAQDTAQAALRAAQANLDLSTSRVRQVQGAARPELHQLAGTGAPRNRAQGRPCAVRAGSRAGRRAGQPGGLCHLGVRHRRHRHRLSMPNPARCWPPARRCCAWPTTARATRCSACRRTRSAPCAY